MLHNKSLHLIVLILFAIASTFISHCVCFATTNDSPKQVVQSKSSSSLLSSKPQTSNITVLSVASKSKKRNLSKNKLSKSSKILAKKYYKLNETQASKTLPLQFAQDLFLQLPDINFAGHIQSALGTKIKGASSRVLLKIHRGLDGKVAQKQSRSQSIKARSIRSTTGHHDGKHELEFEEQDEVTSSSQSSQRPLKRLKREVPCEAGDEADAYADNLIRYIAGVVRGKEPVTLPNATIDLVDYNIQIFLFEGKGTNVYKLKRTKPAWVFCSNDTISLGLTIRVEKLRVDYKYRVISGDKLIFDGDLETRLSPKMQVQISQAIQDEDSREAVMQRVDRIKIFRLGKVQAIIRGLGNLTQSLALIINSYLNDNQDELQPTFRTIEEDAVKISNKLLEEKLAVPIFSLV